MIPPLPQDINKYIRKRIPEVLPPYALSVLMRASDLAAMHGWHLYLVGGYVRDCLLKIPDYDIDLTLVGDAPALARALAQETGAQLEVHDPFGTAVLVFQDGTFDMDIVTARRERYEHPGALPTVEAGTIADDMVRRDFTVNAMAVQILPGTIGPIYDPHGGLDDLRAGLIRVLHDRSFIDDPTRIFRAVKLSVRLDFRIEPHTLELILQAVRDGVFGTLSMDRIRHELLLILEEPKGQDILAELEHLGLLAAIHPTFSWPYARGREIIEDAEHLTKEQRRNAHLIVIAAEFAGEPDEAETLARWLNLPVPLVRLMRDGAQLAGQWERLGQENLKLSEIYRLLQPFDSDVLEAVKNIVPLAQDTIASARIEDHLSRLLYVKPELDGVHLRILGVPPGPIYKRVLDALRDAKLDGLVPDPAAEEAFIRQRLTEEGWAQKE